MVGASVKKLTEKPPPDFIVGGACTTCSRFYSTRWWHRLTRGHWPHPSRGIWASELEIGEIEFAPLTPSRHCDM